MIRQEDKIHYSSYVDENGKEVIERKKMTGRQKQFDVNQLV
jgi:hypothetical protein